MSNPISTIYHLPTSFWVQDLHVYVSDSKVCCLFENSNVSCFRIALSSKVQNTCERILDTKLDIWLVRCSCVLIIAMSIAVVLVLVHILATEKTSKIIVLDIFIAVADGICGLYFMILLFADSLNRNVRLITIQGETITEWPVRFLCLTAASCLLSGIFTPLFLSAARFILVAHQMFKIIGSNLTTLRVSCTVAACCGLTLICNVPFIIASAFCSGNSHLGHDPFSLLLSAECQYMWWVLLTFICVLLLAVASIAIPFISTVYFIRVSAKKSGRTSCSIQEKRFYWDGVFLITPRVLV